MNSSRNIVFPAAFVIALACSAQADRPAVDPQSAELARRDRTFQQRVELASANADTPIALWRMPTALREISGIALTADNRLLAHNDESGRVFEIDWRRGMVVKSFTLGPSPIPADFEAITVAGSDIYMLISNGNLYRFREGADKANVPFEVIDTSLGKECEFEGLTYQADSSWLLMACKNVGPKAMRDRVVIYRWRIGANAGLPSIVTAPIDQIEGVGQGKGVHPTDITIDPATGNYVIITAENVFAEITPAGDVVRAERIPGEHGQPEGVAITKDGILIVSDEATNRLQAAITLYRWRPAAKVGTVSQ